MNPTRLSGSMAVEINRAWWDKLGDRHGSDNYYNVNAFLRGGLSLDERERNEVEEAIGSTVGIRLLHIQCHIGIDTLSWVRLGSQATGVDFSETAIHKAREIAHSANLPATFIVADAQHLPSYLHRQFDLVFASYGIFYWIPDADAWMRSAAAALKTGGSLVMIETHPLAQMFESADPAVAGFPYGGAEPRERMVTSTYSGYRIRAPDSVTVGYAHGIGEIVTSAARAGLTVDSVREYMDRKLPSHRPGNPLTRDHNGRYRLIIGGEDLPVTYSVRATKRA
jgi:ubiquinone/menaquinone biosynthesis C-methylase UbiE